MDYSEYEKFAQPVNLLPMGSYFKTVPEDHSVRWRIIGREDSLIEIERYQDNLLVTSQIDPDIKVYHCNSRGRIPGVDPGADPAIKQEYEAPPIGLRPEQVARDIARNQYVNERSQEILDAMERYNAARKPIPGGWFDELRTLTEERSIIQQYGKFKPTEKDNTLR